MLDALEQGVELSHNITPKNNSLLTKEMSYDWWWLSATDLKKLSIEHKIEERLLWEKLESYDKTIHLSLLLSVLQESLASQGNISRLFERWSEEWEKQMEFEFLSLTEKIWVINWHVRLPLENRILCSSTKETLATIKEKWRLKIWLNSYFVPGSLQTFSRLFARWILDPKDVDITFGSGVNMQENISLMKAERNWHQNHHSLNKFEWWLDIINKVHMHIWDNTSIAHGCTIYWRTDDIWQSIELHTWRWVFIWINTVIWSGSRFSDNVVIWWWSKVWLWVKIWRNTIIWAWANIKDDISIPDNCVVLDWAHIEKWFELIPFEEYKNNEVDYDFEKTNSKFKRNFVIKLSSNKQERLKQVWELGDAYMQMRRFNKSKVIPENKAFSVIDSIISLINESFPELWLVVSKRFENTQDEQKIESLSAGILKPWLHKTSELYLQAYPSNKEEFLFKDVIHIITAIQKNIKPDIAYIKKSFSYPKIPPNYNDVFLWFNSLIWNIIIWDSPNNLIYETSSRWDENTSNDVIKCDDSRLIRCILHWPWNRIIHWTTAIRSCLHGNINATNSTIWEKWHPWTCNNLDISNSIISWRCSLNNANISDSNIWFSVAISTTLDKVVVVGGNSTIWDDSTIRWNNTLTWCKIYRGTFVWEWPERRIQERASLKWMYWVRL